MVDSYPPTLRSITHRGALHRVPRRLCRRRGSRLFCNRFFTPASDSPKHRTPVLFTRLESVGVELGEKLFRGRKSGKGISNAAVGHVHFGGQHREGKNQLNGLRGDEVRSGFRVSRD